MTMMVNITDFRKNISRYADLVGKGYEVEVERAGRKAMVISQPKVDDVIEKGRRAYEIAKKLAGKFPNWDYDRESFRGKKEIDWMRRLEKRSKW